MHIATEAVRMRLSTQPCRDCERKAPWCRGKHPLNGNEAAQEFTRRLLPRARAMVMGGAANG
jgi:hypothetical protein